MIAAWISHKRTTGWSDAFYKGLMLIATLIWGLSYVFMKNAVEVLEPSYLIAIRFLSAGALFALVLHKHIKACHSPMDIAVGCLLGLELYLGFFVQTHGLAHTTPGKNAFLTGTYCIIVPFIAWMILRARPTFWNLIAAIVCFTGIGFVSLQGSFQMEWGDLLTVISAGIFALQIVCVTRFSPGRDVLALTTYQFLSGGLCALIVGLFTESFPPPSSFSLGFVMDMVYLILFATGVAMMFQNMALTHISPSQGALFLSLESVFGVVFSVLLYGEEVTLKLFIGFVLILLSIFISETFPLDLSRYKALLPRREQAPCDFAPHAVELEACELCD